MSIYSGNEPRTAVCGGEGAETSGESSLVLGERAEKPAAHAYGRR